MIVDQPQLAREHNGWMVRRMRVRRGDGRSQHVEVSVPAKMSAQVDDDATAALPLALLLAMRHGEDLEVAARVDPDLHGRLDLIQAYYQAMEPSLRVANVRVAGLLAPTPPPAAFAGVCLSRGVDSLYTCARARTARGPIDCAIFVDGLEPIHDDETRKEEIVLAERAAEKMGLPLVLVRAPHLRELTDGVLDWEDAVGAGMAWIAHALGGGLSRFVLPSTDSLHTLGPCGTSPVLDPLFSSRSVEIEHADVVATRFAKVSWLASSHPELLPLLKVCYAQNRPDNCGRCPKCLHTMVCLRIAGVLERASGFPRALDLDALATLSLPQVSMRYEFAELHDAAVRVGDGELAGALSELIGRTVRDGVVADQEAINTFRSAHTNALLTITRTGLADPSAGRNGPFGASCVGLLRTLDVRARRHSYTTSGAPAAALTAELGALPVSGCAPNIPLWILADGRVVTRRYLPAAPRAGHWTRLRFCLDPFRSARDGALGTRLRIALRRLADAWLLSPPLPARVPDASEPLGYLFEAPGSERVPLWSGVHPVTGDQLLTWSAEGLGRAGYVDRCLLGYLLARAPHTGRLGTHATPIVPWAGAGQMILDEAAAPADVASGNEGPPTVPRPNS